MKRILLVEDDPVTIMLFSQFLKTDYDIMVAPSVAKACEMIVSQKIDLVLLDYILPDGFGIEVLDFIVAKKMRLKCIVITKFSQLDIISACRKKGAFDFIQKPIKRQLLHEYVDIALNFPDLLSQYNEPNLANPQKNQDIPEGVFHFDLLKNHLDADYNLIGETIFTGVVELPSIASSLKTIVVCDDPEALKSALFCLHRAESIARMLFAGDLLRQVEDLLASVYRGEMPLPADTIFISRSIDQLTQALHLKLKELAKEVSLSR
jgi:CheY-like chemotaxis protein